MRSLDSRIMLGLLIALVAMPAVFALALPGSRGDGGAGSDVSEDDLAVGVSKAADVGVRLLRVKAEAGEIVGSFLGSTTTSSLSINYDADTRFAIFPTEPLSSLIVGINFYDYNYDGAYPGLETCANEIEGVAVTEDGQCVTFDFSGIEGGLRQSQDLLACEWYSHEPGGPADADDWDVYVVEARGLEGELLTNPSLCQRCFTVNGSSCWNTYLCGDAVDDGSIDASDALLTLSSAVGTGECAAFRCDTDSNGKITARDALAILQASVGVSTSLLCPAAC